jgi:predicted phosphoadenosine phosphosulfate sulfurtransferase
MPDVAHRIIGPEKGTCAMVRGIRAAESLRRYRSIAHRRDENWITEIYEGYAYQCSPIYDWRVDDVWTAPRLLGWDYNRAYDVMAMSGIAPNEQRCCPPYGEEPLRKLWTYAICWPDLWHKMIARVPGAATAGRYAEGELYGQDLRVPEGHTWRTWTHAQLDLYPEEYRSLIAASIARLLKDHRAKTNRPVSEDEPDPWTGLSWKFLATLVNRGDLKGRRGGAVSVYGAMSNDAEERSEYGRY